ncbi:RNA-directed DNA polymerase from mobile element jockey [Rhizoctonia solani]|uniref:RNA-directed DNA polymerase from mobile element jockey n=1 Tax=Rhizoctonia solani TaxID=456999 RepID=A0A8H8SYD4_9AGAM|nr:RNA-directed DNA polymerase from mobile element jockey [Rhizoctonia solani]QRW23081.1 RNA-directed DNA polymerase from mobile element jockey [Rhizoctonia solani]
MSASSQGRKPPNTGAVARKPSLSPLNTTSINTAQPQPATAQMVKIEPANAETYLESEGILDKESRVTFDLISVALLNTASDTKLTEDTLRARVRALALVGQKYTTEFIAQQTVTLVMEEVKRAQELGKAKAEMETEEVRQSLDKAKTALAEEISRVIEAKNIWLKATEDLTSLKETVSKLQLAVEDKSEETKGKMGQLKDAIERAADEMIMDRQLAREDIANSLGPMGNPYPFNPLYTNTAGDPNHYPYPGPPPRSYADAAALPPSVSQPERDIQQQQALDRLRGSEEKRDRQLMLDADDVGANGHTDLTEKELTEKIDKALQDLTAESLYNIEEVGVLHCDKVTKLPRGGVLILMNSIKSKKFLDQPDIAERFTEVLGITTKIIPRKFKVVIEKVSINTNLGNPKLPRRIEKDNGLVEGELVGLKWIKNPAQRSPNQRHAHIVAEFRTKSSANAFIKEPRLIEHEFVHLSKYNTDSFRCFKCQRPGHKSAECPQHHKTCGTCAQNHQTDKCNRTANPHCVTCNEAGHATWDRNNCPKYFIPNNSRSMHTADRHYKYYVTDEQWTWAPASNLSKRPTQTCRSAPITDFIQQNGRKNGGRQPRAATASSTGTQLPVNRPGSRALGHAQPSTPTNLIQTTLPFTSPIPPRYSPCRPIIPGPPTNETDPIPTVLITDVAPAPLANPAVESTNV